MAAAPLDLSEAGALDALLDFLRIPSVSTDPAHAADCRRCAEWVAGWLGAAGFPAEIVPTPGHPAVIAAGPQRPGRPALLLYGHYDVQPTDPLDEWTGDPFEPAIRDGKIIARGASDNKGQIFAHMLGAARALAEHGDLPVNLTFLIEGEEEIGSASLPALLRERRAQLACDAVALSDNGVIAPGFPTLAYGLRGVAGLEVHVHGPASDQHSGVFGGAIENPARALAVMLASLHDADGRVAIPGFYDAVAPQEDWERAAQAALPGADDGAETLAITGAPALAGEAGRSDYERRCLRPTAEINGIGGGFQGPGSKTIVPARAMAKLSFRLLPDQKPAAILDAAETHLRAVAPPGVRIEIERHHSGPPYFMDPRGRWGMAAQAALRDAFGRAPALVREGGAIPIVQSFREILGADTLLLALADPDCNAHGPDESFPAARLEEGARLHRALLRRMAAA